MAHASAVIPVKDGERWLERVLAAIAEQGEDVEVLVIDSGSRDRSREIARGFGVELLEIAPDEFGHGRTRNLGAERTSGDPICFLTQDAIPVPGWLAAHREALELTADVGASYGPHLPHPETSPMIARELDEFFATMSVDGAPAVHRDGDLAFLSNVNAAYARACWEQIRFDDVPYAEDQAFGRAMLAAGWAKVYHPAAAVLHAHDYGVVDFTRRYFDEYRGLRETIGHVESARPTVAARDVATRVRADLRWMRAREIGGGERARWALRSALHHGGRRVGAVLGSRAHRLPDGMQSRLSLEGRGAGAGSAPHGGPPARQDGPPRGATVPPARSSPDHGDLLDLAREGTVPLLEPVPGQAERERLHLAFAIPPFRRGSGGHALIFELIRRLEEAGHTCTIWVHHPEGRQHGAAPAVWRRRALEWFTPIRAPFFTGFADWHGADVAVATGWETAFPLARRDRCRARAYLVSDHEPEFFATSAERLWAEQTYGLGFHVIAGSSWLHDLVIDRYGGEGTWYSFGVDQRVYRPRPVRRRDDTVAFYARGVTPRRAVPLGALALEELKRRRPDVRVVMFGDTNDVATTFEYEQLGITAPERLAWTYSEATVGLCLSLTHYSLIPQEMMACGLPCVDVEGGSAEAVFGRDGVVELADADPIALADAIERLLDDRDRRRARAQAGLEFVRGASWDRAAEQVEGGLRAALKVAAERSAGASGTDSGAVTPKEEPSRS
ncbi:MAG: glycosyltransferase [Thermoleophilaceae bacterium]